MTRQARELFIKVPQGLLAQKKIDRQTLPKRAACGTREKVRLSILD
jgi:hypothetical protein